MSHSIGIKLVELCIPMECTSQHTLSNSRLVEKLWFIVFHSNILCLHNYVVKIVQMECTSSIAYRDILFSYIYLGNRSRLVKTPVPFASSTTNVLGTQWYTFTKSLLSIDSQHIYENYLSAPLFCVLIIGITILYTGSAKQQLSSYHTYISHISAEHQQFAFRTKGCLAISYNKEFHRVLCCGPFFS